MIAKRIVMSLNLAVLAFISSVSLAGVFAQSTYAASCPGGEARLLTFPAWYNGVVDNDCNLDIPDTTVDDDGDALIKFVFRIGLNVSEIILQLVAYGTIVMIMKGGFDYLTSNGEEAKLTSSKTTIRNAIIGLVIALSSVAIVNLVSEIV